VEGYADKWAYRVPADRFRDLGDQWQTLQDFMSFCNVTKKPNFQQVLL
jgi:hypothetical protein